MCFSSLLPYFISFFLLLLHEFLNEGANKKSYDQFYIFFNCIIYLTFIYIHNKIYKLSHEDSAAKSVMLWACTRGFIIIMKSYFLLSFY